MAVSKIQPKPLLDEKPLNREPKVDELLSSFITRDQAYDRNHGLIPEIDLESHCVVIDGEVKTQRSLSLHDLATLFTQHEVVCVLQCAGNRRHTMRTWMREVDGIDWSDAALMNCRWRGPRLRDVLLHAGVRIQQGHVAFACFQSETEKDSWYGASIALERAMDLDSDVILALERNSMPLSPNHGAPVRIIVPGVAGARSVKWVDRITVQGGESQNFYHTHDYKILPEHVSNAEEAEEHWDSLPALQDMPVNSVIISPRSGSSIQLEDDGTIEIAGYAVPGGSDGPVIRVEVSIDGQNTWLEAHLGDERSKWSWCLWKARVKADKGVLRRIFSRAVDQGGNEQTAEPAWNLRGVAYNGYGESRDVTVV